MPFRHPTELRRSVVDRVLHGDRPVAAARSAGVSVSCVYLWLAADAPHVVAAPPACCRCADVPAPPADGGAYAQLLGLYLGDGCLSRGRAAWVLRITCDDRYPRVADEAAAVVAAISGRRVSRARKQGCHDVTASWRHWLCLLPQHGPGKKHERPIVLEPWQQALVDAHPGRFVRGLMHSDGWRGDNVAVRRSGDTVVRYRYPRYAFCNRSDDVRALCGQALDRLGVAWRPNGRERISVARREAVAALDAHVGPKA